MHKFYENGRMVRSLMTAAAMSALVAGATAVTANAATLEELEKRVEDLETGTGGLKVSKKGGLRVTTEDKKFDARFGGRIQADVAIFDDDKTPVASGHEFRRVRLFTDGTWEKVWKYKVQIDFETGGAVDLEDVYIRYVGWKPFELTIGNQKEPFSLEELTSSKYITFMERALPNLFSPSRNFGAQGQYAFDMGTFSVGLFGEGVDTGGGATNDPHIDLVARGTIAPIAEDDKVLHLGAAVHHRNLNSGSTLRLRERPEAHIPAVRFVDTGTLAGVDDVLTYGLEAAGVLGPVSIQGEYIMADVGRTGAGVPEPDFSGFYIYGSWFVTGESRAYKKSSGTFDRPKVYDAVELAVRFSSLDLEDSGILGGEEDNITIGANYYFNPHVRLMFNYVNADIDDGPLAGDEDFDAFMTRLQIDF